MRKRKVGVCCVVFLVLCGVLIEAGYSQSYSHLAPQSRLPRQEDVKEPEARKTGEVIVVTYEFLYNPTAQDTLQERRLRFYLLASHLVEDWSGQSPRTPPSPPRGEGEVRAALAALAPDVHLDAMKQALSARDAAAMRPLLAQMSKTLPLYMSYGFMGHADETSEHLLAILKDHEKNPPEEISLEDKMRIAKLIEYHFVTHEEQEKPGLGKFVLDYFDRTQVIYEYRGRSVYMAVVNPFLGKYQIWIHGKIKEGVDHAKIRMCQSEGLSEDEAKRLAALFHTQSILHEVIGRARSERFSGRVEGEYFEILMEVIFIRGLSQNDFELLHKFTHYVDEYTQGKPLKMGEGNLERVLPMWRDLDPQLFKEVLSRTKRGIEWFEKTMLPLCCPNEEYVYPDGRKSRISHVIQKWLAEERKTGKWKPILSRGILNDIDAFIGFQNLARRSIAAIDMEGQRKIALRKFEYSLMLEDNDQIFPSAVDVFKNDPFYRAMAVETDWDKQPFARTLVEGVDIEIAVDLSLIADLKRTAEGKYKITPQLGQIIDMMVMREAMCAQFLRWKLDVPVADPRDKVRFHILTGDVPPEEAEKMLEEFGLRNKFCTVAKDAADLLCKINKFYLEKGYDKWEVEDAELPRWNTCFALNYENMKNAVPATDVKPSVSWDIDSFKSVFGSTMILLAFPYQPMGYVTGLTYLCHLEHKHHFLDRTPNLDLIKQWLALTLPLEKVRTLNPILDVKFNLPLSGPTVKMDTADVVNRLLQQYLLSSTSL